MALQPLDLQTLFSQLDKVGKLQTSQREGLAIQQSMQSIETQKKTEEQIQSVDEAKQTGDGAEAVNDRNARKKSGEQSGDKEGGAGENHDQTDLKKKAPVIVRDPSLGKNIDMSG